MEWFTSLEIEQSVCRPNLGLNHYNLHVSIFHLFIQFILLLFKLLINIAHSPPPIIISFPSKYA